MEEVSAPDELIDAVKGLRGEDLAKSSAAIEKVLEREPTPADALELARVLGLLPAVANLLADVLDSVGAPELLITKVEVSVGDKPRARVLRDVLWTLGWIGRPFSNGFPILDISLGVAEIRGQFAKT